MHELQGRHLHRLASLASVTIAGCKGCVKGSERSALRGASMYPRYYVGSQS